MEMSLEAKKKGNGDMSGTFKSAPAGQYRAWCYSWNDLGTQQTAYGPKRQVRLGFELADLLMEDGKPYIQTTFPMTRDLANEEAKLHKFVDVWFDNEAFTGKKSFDIEQLFVTPCDLYLKEVTGKNGKTYVNIDKITRCKNTEGMPARVNPVTFFDFDEFDQGLFDSFHDDKKTRLMATPEYQELFNKAPEVPEGETSVPAPDYF